jgi:plastocyanin
MTHLPTFCKEIAMRLRKKWGILILVPAAAVLCILGCGSETGTKPAAKGTGDSGTAAAPSVSTPSAPTPTPSTPSKAPDVKPAAGKATVYGKVRYAGEPPKRRAINFGPEQKCHVAHKTPPLEESVVVSPDKGLQWALVRVAGKVPGTFKPPAKPAELDQKGCVFIPHILAVQAGQDILIKNSDTILHNVRSEAVLNSPFNRNLPKEGDTMTVKFDSGEIGIKMKCDVHFWMEGYIHVIPHPFFAVTGPDGSYSIPDLPPGDYKLEVWHEKLGKQSQDVTVADGETKTVEFEFKPKS